MKPATRAPFFACLYHTLCDVARERGYALAIHGSLICDLDLIAVPWTEAAIPAQELRDALAAHLNANGYADMLRRAGYSEDFAQEREREDGPTMDSATVKPHGRLAWNLYMDFGAKVDLSVMPRKENAPPATKS